MRTPKPRYIAPLALVALLAAGCGGGDEKSVSQPASSGSTAASSAASGSSSVGATSTAAVPADAVAIVDGTPILKTDFKHLVDIAIASAVEAKQPAPAVGSPEYEKLKQQALSILIQRELIAREAADAGVKVDKAKVDESLKQAVDAAGGQTKWDEQLKKTKATKDDYLKTFEIQQLAQGLFESLTKDVKVTDADIQAAYEKDKETTYKVPKSRKVAHILIDVNGNSKADAKDLAKAEEVLKLVNEGGDFGALAKKYSADPGSKDNGGEYDELEGQFVPEFEKVSFGLDTGKWSEKPVKTQFGYHIIKALGDLTPPGYKPLSEVKEQIRTSLAQELKNKIGADWFAKAQTDYEKKATFADGYSLPPKAPAAAASSTGASSTS